MKPALIITLLFLLTSTPAIPQSCASPDPASHTKTGDKMPNFTVTDTTGKPFSIASLKGKVLLVNFWATWCGPCRQEMPRLEKEVWKSIKSDNFVMLAIAREQSAAEITAFQKSNPYTFPMAPDVKRATYALFADSGIPRSYIVSSDGTIAFQTVGYCPKDFDDMLKVLKQALNSEQKH